MINFLTNITISGEYYDLVNIKSYLLSNGFHCGSIIPNAGHVLNGLGITTGDMDVFPKRAKIKQLEERFNVTGELIKESDLIPADFIGKVQVVAEYKNNAPFTSSHDEVFSHKKKGNVMIREIETPSDIAKIINDNPDFDDWERYGKVNVKREGDKYLFNYTAEAQFSNDWNAFERMSRGLIMQNGFTHPIARPFDKFFNWMEHGRHSKSNIDYVMDKMDGSLGICWYDDSFTGWRITTRGSFDSEQAVRATNMLHRKYVGATRHLEIGFTYLFEIIYPENRIVVDYGEEEALYLLAIRSNRSGWYLQQADVRAIASEMGVKYPLVRKMTSTSQIEHAKNQFKGTENEGFIAVMEDGSRWKFKGDDYFRLHKIISSISFKNVLQAKANDEYETYLEVIPDEFQEQVREWSRIINDEAHKVHEDVLFAFKECQRMPSRKGQALYLRQHHADVMPFVFSKLDGKYNFGDIYKKHDFSKVDPT